MISFTNDYSEGCYPTILQALENINNNQFQGYGTDDICKEARKRIRTVLNDDDCEIHFLVGGTQANLIVISALLKPYEGVICTDLAHINTHETGSIEAVGHKCLTLPSYDGKLRAKDVKKLIIEHFEDSSFEHTVKPGMVYISNSTEVGTIYSKKELEDLYMVCKEFNIPLFIDGARLASALTCKDNDVDVKDISHLCDVFYLGGTKNGALFGEAVVFSDPDLVSGFRYNIKQRGGMLAKGWLLGLQFNELFKDNIYFKLGLKANEQAMKIVNALKECHIELAYTHQTNQIFAIFDNDILEELSIKYSYTIQNKVDNKHTCIRLCTSWATKDEDVCSFINDLKELALKK